MIYKFDYGSWTYAILVHYKQILIKNSKCEADRSNCRWQILILHKLINCRKITIQTLSCAFFEYFVTLFCTFLLPFNDFSVCVIVLGWQNSALFDFIMNFMNTQIHLKTQYRVHMLKNHYWFYFEFLPKKIYF